MKRFIIFAILVAGMAIFFFGCDNGGSSSSVTIATRSPRQLTAEANAKATNAALPLAKATVHRSEYTAPGEPPRTPAPATPAPAVMPDGSKGKVARPIELPTRAIGCNEGNPVHIATSDGEILGCQMDPAAGSQEPNY